MDKPVAEAHAAGPFERVEAVRRSRADERVAAVLRAEILGGVHAPGSTLPGERELSVLHGVSRLTLRAALSRLEADGLVMATQGSGTRVLAWRATGGIEMLAHLAALGLRGGEDPTALLGGVLEVRRWLAVEAFAALAERATPAELAGLRAHVEVQAALVGDPERYVAADLAFARKVAEATHNVALVLLANTAVRMVEPQAGMRAAFLADPEATLSFYRRVLDMAGQRSADQVRAFTRRVLSHLDRALGFANQTHAGDASAGAGDTP